MCVYIYIYGVRVRVLSMYLFFIHINIYIYTHTHVLLGFRRFQHSQLGPAWQGLEGLGFMRCRVKHCDTLQRF